MSVIAHLRVPPDSFELGRILDVVKRGTVQLETLVPLGERAVPFFTVYGDTRRRFEESVRDHSSVDSIREVSTNGDETLYALDWDASRDQFFRGMVENDARLLAARGTTAAWEFEIRFQTHDALSSFQEHCSDAQIDIDLGRVYNPSRPGTGAWYGLSEVQRATLIRAVQGGYYSIPREISTKELADTFDISDQAVTERLRRAISTLAENTVVAAQEKEGEETFPPAN
jgi:predicted DNA binding protein